MLRAALLSACLSAASATLFSLAKHGADGLVLLRVAPNGARTAVGPPFGNASFTPTQGVSAVDAAARVLYTILTDEHAHNKPSLYGLSLTTGAIVTAVPLPLVNGDSIGEGQVIGLVRATGDVIVAGSDDKGGVGVYAVTPASGSIRVVAELNASAVQISPGCSHVAHDPATNELFFGGYDTGDYSRLILRVNLATGALKRIANPEGHRISGFSFDEVTGTVVGLGSRGEDEEIILAQINTTSLATTVFGAVPSVADSSSGLEALDAAAGTLTWLGGNDTDTPFSLIVSELRAGAPVASSVEVCATFDSCDLLTLDFAPDA